jgi:carbonic anhydrase
MKGLLQLGELEETMPLVYEWLRHTQATRKLVEDHYGHLDKKAKLDVLVAQNVLTQIDNLRTYPSIHSRLHADTLSIHGWIYNIANAQLLAYDEEVEDFVAPHSKISPLADGVQPLKPGGLSVPPGTPVATPASEPPQPYWPGVNRLSPQQAARIYRGRSA